MRRRVAFLLVGLILLGSGCQRSSPPPGAQHATTTAVATTIPSPGTTTGSSGGAVTTTSTTAVTGSCQSAALTATLTGASAAAGTAYSHLVFRNNSPRSCTMAGYPGVSFVDGSGHQIGGPVPREHRFAGNVTMAPGGSAGALFAYHDVYVSTSDGCRPAIATGLRVYPPNQAAALFVARAMMVCSNPETNGTASISEVTALAALPGPG